jgi:LysR family hydrogen peroxide-inducible transcriptional activator
MRLPTTKQLRYLVALDEHRHFGHAAEACFVSQSAFSIAIRELETVLGAHLVDRTNKQVTITRTGQDVVVQARLCLRDIEALVALARGDQEPLAGRLYLGIIPTIAPFLLPRVMPGLRRLHPSLELFVKEDVTARVYEELMAGTVDAIVVALPYDLANVETEVLFRDHFHLAFRRGSERVDPDHYSVASMREESILLLDDGHCMREHALQACRIRNLGKINRFAASGLFTLVQMVDSDLGVTYLPEIAIGSNLLSGTAIQTMPLRERSYREVALAWRRGSARGEEFRLLAGILGRLGAPRRRSAGAAKGD